MEKAAVSLLQRAVEMDNKEQYTMALTLYREGLQILLDIIKGIKDDLTKRRHFQAKAVEYMDRAERVKDLIEERKATGKFREQTRIEAGSTGHGYNSVFGRFLDASITRIHVEDPYIRAFHQCQNLLRLCELAVQKCPSLSKVSLVTTQDQDIGQSQRLNELKLSLAARKVTFDVSFSETLHDRQIRLSNGWVIKIGRGLDYFKAPEKKFALGACDLELRPCLETTIDIFHKSHLQNSEDPN